MEFLGCPALDTFGPWLGVGFSLQRLVGDRFPQWPTK